MTASYLDLLDDLVIRARKAGADAADAVLTHGISVGIAQRLGQLEKLERSEGQDLGLRVFIGRQQAIVSSNDFSSRAMEELVARAVAMAKLAPEDPFCGIADPEQLARDFPDLDTVDPIEPSTETLIARAAEAEEAMRAITGVTNSEGADAGWGSAESMLVTSAGFARTNRGTWHSLSAVALAGEGTGMERDYDWTSAVHAEDLEAPALIGRRAGERAVRRLNPRKLETCKVPVFFDRRIAARLIGAMLGAISGPSIARGTSFLKDKLGQEIFNPAVTILEDPFRKRGSRSAASDAEGLPRRARALVDKGVLTTWLLDLRSARQLGMAPTGHASRGTGGPPGPAASNVALQPGETPLADLLKAQPAALLVTDLMGHGVNGVTGDYSLGAAGFWVENGEITGPVSEITIAGNLKDMYRTLTPADDLILKTGMDSPTVRIEGMTIAGL